MNRVQSGDMPSMDEIMGDPALRDLYVDSVFIYASTYHRTTFLRASKFGSGARP